MRNLLCLLFVSLVSATSYGASPSEYLKKEGNELLSLYYHLHRNPELSLKEVKTANQLARRMRKLGLKVTEQVGGTGVVGVLENGKGPKLLIRADMDALPVTEETGLSYASQVQTLRGGQKVGVMHACGHDIHMSVLLGTLQYLSENPSLWQGTVIAVLQPAEELGLGAKAMIKSGLFDKFGVPDFGLALHVSAEHPAGSVGYVAGFAMANADTVTIKVKGQGGHGAFPHNTRDPIVLASKIVLGLQTIVTREIAPTDPSVISVGYFHGGTKSNVIPNEVELRATVRSFSDETRQKIMAAIRRTAEGLAASSGFPKSLYPEVILKEGFTPALYNDPALVERVKKGIATQLKDDQILKSEPVMGAEDFGRYGKTKPQFPITMFWLGSVSPKDYQKFKAGKLELPSLHSSRFAPQAQETLFTGVKAMAGAAVELLPPKRESR